MKLVYLILLASALSLACEQHPLESLREMYGLGTLAEFQRIGSTKFFMFNHAIAHDDLEALKILYTHAINTRSQKMVYEDFRLSQARREGGEPVWFYPLHLCAQFGAVKVAAFCLENGADINKLTASNAPEFDKNTPAHIATAYGMHEVLKMILSRGDFNMASRNSLSKTVEDIARDKNDQVALSIIEDAKNKIK